MGQVGVVSRGFVVSGGSQTRYEVIGEGGSSQQRFLVSGEGGGTQQGFVKSKEDEG